MIESWDSNIAFHKDEEEIKNPDEIEDRDTTHGNILHPRLGWIPQLGKDQYLDSYGSLTLKIFKDTKKPKKHYKKNLKKDDITAVSILRNNRNIISKPADKGGAVVIMNSEDYIKEV